MSRLGKWRLSKCLRHPLAIALALLSTGCAAKRTQPVAVLPVEQPLPTREPFHIRPPLALDYAALLDDVIQAASGNSDEALDRSLILLFGHVLTYSAGLYGLTPYEIADLPATYRSQHSGVAEDAARRLKSLMTVEREALAPEIQAFQFASYSAAQRYGDMFSTIACDVASLVVSLVARKPAIEVANIILSKPCAKLLVELVTPIFVELENHGLIRDQLDARLEITRRIRATINELAVIHDRTEATLSTSASNRRLWLFTSSGDLTTKVVANIKAGFDLSKSLDLRWNERDRTAVVILPSPEILSVDIEYTILSIRDWIVRDVNESHLNAALATARERLIATSVRSGLLDRARMRASEVIRLLFGPLVAHPHLGYSIRVEFRSS